MKKDNPVLSIFLLALLILSCKNQQQNTIYPGETWERSTPEAQGVDSGELLKALEFMNLPESGVDSMVIIRNGYIIAEFYREPFDSTTTHRMNSCTKSFTSALVGIAIDEGLIKNVNQPVLSYFDEVDYAEDKVEKITIKDLLTMRSGFLWRNTLDYYDSNNDGRIFQHQDDQLNFAFTRPVVDKPGTTFSYNSINSQLLADIVHRVSDMQSDSFAREKLLEPIGIDNWTWRKSTEGSIFGGTGLVMSTEDLARLGYLYLHDGIWNGDSVVPKKWVRNSIRPYTSTKLDEPNGMGFPIPYYGYQWWVWDRNIFLAVGGGGQLCWINKARNIVVAINSDAEVSQKIKIYTSLFGKLSRMNISDSSLSENREGTSMLIDYISSSEKAPQVDYKEGAQIVQEINGKEIILYENSLNLDSIVFNFDQEKMTLTINNEEDFAFNIGQDYLQRTTEISPQERPFGNYHFEQFSRVTNLTDKSISFEFINTGRQKGWITYTLEEEDYYISFTKHTHTYGNRQDKEVTIYGKIDE